MIITPLGALLCHTLSTRLRQPAHVHEMVEELGSILTFAGRPLPNHAADKVIFFQYRPMDSRTNDSWGMFVRDVSSGERKLLDAFSTADWKDTWIYGQVVTFGWSPDDNYFAYARKEMKELVICDVNAGKAAATFPMKVKITSGAWLASQSFVCTDTEKIFDFEQSGDQWLGPQDNFRRGEPVGRNIDFLRAYSTNVLLWKQGNTLRSVSKSMDAPTIIWEPPTNDTEILEYTYSPEAQKILLHARDNQGRFFAELNVRNPLQQKAISVRERYPREHRPSQVRIINNGLGRAYLNKSDYSLNFPVITQEKNQAPLQLPWQGEIKSFEVSGPELFVIGAMTNEPIGIWKYDLVTGSLNCLVSNQQHPFKYATSQPVVEIAATNTLGQRLTCYVLEPSHSKAGRPPPLVLGVMGEYEKAYYWDRYSQTIANCGAYFVTVDRRNRAETEWADDVMCAYDTLTRKLVIDTNQVYLLGISVGAAPINLLLETGPERWRGAIYESPSSLPNPAGLRSKNFLIDIGGLDELWGKDSVRAKDFRDAAASAGADVTLLIRPEVGHNCRILSIEKERLHQLAAFLSKP